MLLNHIKDGLVEFDFVSMTSDSKFLNLNSFLEFIFLLKTSFFLRLEWFGHCSVSYLENQENPNEAFGCVSLDLFNREIKKF